MTLTPLFRIAALAGAAALAACTPFSPDDLPPLGDFRLGHNVVLARDVVQGPFSRDATRDELTTALADAIEERLIGYDGDGLYHLGISIGGYALAKPGLPVVYTPKSILVFDVTLFDNDTGERLNEEPFRITAFEGLENTAPVIGSGLARSKEEQLHNLVTEGARQLHSWLIDNSDWFVPDPDQGRTEFDRAEWKAKLAATLAGQPAAGSAAAATPPGASAPAPAPAAPGGGTVSPLTLPMAVN